jgi:hypothetical protein
LSLYLTTPVLAGMTGQERVGLGAVDRTPLSSGEQAFLECCRALHTIEATAHLFDYAHRTLLVAALDSLTLTIEDTL